MYQEPPKIWNNLVMSGTHLVKKMWGIAQKKHMSATNQRPKIIRNFDEFCKKNPTKKALISYLVDPLLPPPSKRDRQKFSNWGIAQQIPQALNELGYCVDILSYDFPNFIVDQEYDLFIGHGAINFDPIVRQLPTHTIIIYFSTGIYWKEWNIREAERIYNLALRRGYLLNPDRKIVFSEENPNITADGIICLGNEFAVQTYKQFPTVVGIKNATYPLHSALPKRDYQNGRQNFLFFSGGGNIHKGLDLLLEAFASTNLHLHICQSIDKEFGDVYRYELTQCPNIHLHGLLPMRSQKFEELTRRCSWTISATCAEGQPGAVLECMAYGIIPILPNEANIDLEDFGILLPDCNVETIRSVIQNTANYSIDECIKRATLAKEATMHTYTPDNFTCEFKHAVNSIVETKNK